MGVLFYISTCLYTQNKLSPQPKSQYPFSPPPSASSATAGSLAAHCGGGSGLAHTFPATGRTRGPKGLRVGPTSSPHGVWGRGFASAQGAPSFSPLPLGKASGDPGGTGQCLSKVNSAWTARQLHSNHRLHTPGDKPRRQQPREWHSSPPAKQGSRGRGPPIPARWMVLFYDSFNFHEANSFL